MGTGQLFPGESERDVDGRSPLHRISVDSIRIEAPVLQRIKRRLTKKRRSIQDLKAEHGALTGDVHIDDHCSCDSGCASERRIGCRRSGQHERPGLLRREGDVQRRWTSMCGPREF